MKSKLKETDMPKQMSLREYYVYKHILFFIVLISNASSYGASSFFAKGLIQRFFEIEVIPEKILTKKVNYQPSESSPNNTPIQLLVWNIYKGDLFKKSPLPLDYNQFDIIFFQEYSDHIAPNLLPHKNLYFLPTFKWEKALTGVAIYSNNSLKKVTPLQTKYREPFILTPKASIIADYKGVTLVNTHALNFVAKDEWIFELNQIAKFLKNKKKVIWAGDFNTWSMERTQYLANLVSMLGLKEVQFPLDNRTLHLGHHVDHIFVKGVRYSHQTVHEAKGRSDHNPLTLTINSK